MMTVDDECMDNDNRRMGYRWIDGFAQVSFSKSHKLLVICQPRVIFKHEDLEQTERIFLT